MLLYGKVVDTSPELNMLASLPQQNALYAMNNNYHSTHMPFEGLVLFSCVFVVLNRKRAVLSVGLPLLYSPPQV